MTVPGFEPAGRIELGDAATVYAEGWQSWSPAQITGAKTAPWQPGSADSAIVDWAPGALPSPGELVASGLLAVAAAPDAPVRVFSAHSAERAVPQIKATWRGEGIDLAVCGEVEEFVDDGPGGMPGALARFARRFSERAGVGPLRPIPAMWCSWYSHFHAITEQDVLANLDLLEELDLDVGIVQVDDGYQASPGDWLVPSAHFGDLERCLGLVRAAGRAPGIWLAPFAVGRTSALAAAHPDWLVRDEAGEPVSAGGVLREGCFALDVSHPGAAAYLSDVLATFRSYGVELFKLDFLYAGALEGRRRSPLSGVEAFRLGLGLIREAVGPQSLLLGCGAPILPAVGLVDAMRIGPDIAARARAEPGQPTMPCQENAARNTVARAFQHGRFWVNDPDCMLADPRTEAREAWAGIVERYGPLRSCGDDLRRLDEWGIDTMRRLLRPSPLEPIITEE